MKMRSKTIALAIACMSAAAAPAQELPRHPDILPGIVMSMAVADEVRAQCIATFPDLKDGVEEAYAAWPLAKTSISVKVNGKDYVMPQIEQLRESIRRQFQVGATARNRRECERYGADMQKAIAKIPPEWLAPFLPEGR